MTAYPADEVEAFWARVNRGDSPDQCWEWTGPRNPRTGQGRLTFGHGQQAAHRVAYQLAIGPIPAGMLILHRCSNPLCCNPVHLTLGTSADLMASRRRVTGAAPGK